VTGPLFASQMNKEELNREIAEKLMGYTAKEQFGYTLSADPEPFCYECWMDSDNNEVLASQMLNYFTEGWEQAVDVMVGTGKIEIVETTSSVEIKTGHRVTHYTVAIYIENGRGEFMMASHNLLETREKARRNAMKQVWPEILKRIDNGER